MPREDHLTQYTKHHTWTDPTQPAERQRQRKLFILKFKFIFVISYMTTIFTLFSPIFFCLHPTLCASAPLLLKVMTSFFKILLLYTHKQPTQFSYCSLHDMCLGLTTGIR